MIKVCNKSHAGAITRLCQSLMVTGVFLFPSYCPGQSWVSDSQYTNQPSLATINASSAYLSGFSGLGVKVGIVDSGINPNNLAFSGALVGGYNAVTGLTGVSNLADYGSYHGSFTASEIIARRGNGGYFQGLAYNSGLVVGAAGPSLTDATLSSSLNYVSSQGVKVINNSWGSSSSGTYPAYAFFNPLTVSALQTAVSRGVALVFSAGNDGTAQPSPQSLMPLNNSAVAGSFIVAAATTVNGIYMARANGTGGPGVAYTDYCGAAKNYCISAPGGLIAGTYTNGTTLTSANLIGYDARPVIGINGASNSNTGVGITYDIGTSMSAPFVTGAVALVSEAFPWMTSSQLTTSVLTTGTAAANPSEIYGRGLLNVGMAVKGPGIFESTFTADTGGYSSIFGNAISGSYGLIKQGLGTLSFVGNNTYSGSTIINAGVLQVGIGGASGTIGLGGVSDNASLIFNRSNSLTVNNNIVGSGFLQQSGSGNLTLVGINSYSGGTQVDAGSNLIINSGAALGTGAVSLVGNSTTPATLTTSSNLTINNSIHVSGDPVFNVASNTTTSITSIISNGSAEGDVVASGGGTLNLQGRNTYTGATTVNSGSKLALSGVGTISSSSGLLNNGSFDITNTASGATISNLTGSGGTVLGSKLLTINNASGAYSGIISGTGDLLIQGGSQILSGVNTYLGLTTINSGATLSLSGLGTIANTSGVIDNGIFSIASAASSLTLNGLSGNGVLSLGGNSLTLGGSAFTGSITGSGSLSFAGPLQQISSTNTFSGNVGIQSGSTMALIGNGSISNASNLTNNGIFDISGTNSGAALTSLSGSGQTNLGAKGLMLTNASGSYSGNISGTGGVAIAGGSETFSGINSFSGGLTVQSGASLTVSSGGALGHGGLSLVGSSSIPATLNVTSTTSISNPISVAGDPVFNIGSGTTTTVFSTIADGTSSGDVVVQGGGSLNLTAINTYTGSTTVNAGSTLLLSGIGSVATSNAIVNNGVFDISGLTSSSSINSLAGSGLTYLGGNNLALSNASTTYGGIISGSGGLSLMSGIQTFSGGNTYSGFTYINDGAILALQGSGSIASSSSITANGLLDITNSSHSVMVSGLSGSGGVQLGSNTLNINNGVGLFSGSIVGSGGLNLISSSQALSGINIYTGLTNIDAGSTLSLIGLGSVTASSSIANYGTLNIASKTSNALLGGSFTQTSSGTLAMSFYPLVPKTNQQVNIAGAANLAGTLSLTAFSGAYRSGRYTLLTAGSVVGTFGTFSSNLASLTRYNYALSYDAQDVYLNFISNSADTQQSLVNTASALQNTYTLQNSVLANSLNYDCTEFGPNGICISVGGRNTAVSAANGLNNTSGLLIAAYRLHPNYRIGAYADQNLSVNNAGSTVNLGNNTPLIGVFGVWNQKLDGTGTEVKVSAAYGQKNTTVTRSVVGTSEAGSGSSQLNSQGAQVVTKYGFGITDNVIVSPYAGMRYTQNNMGGYTEGTSATVTAPLTYSALNTNATTALAGVGASYKFIPQAMVFASAGVETDTNTANGTYSATGVTGLTPINFNANPVKTRPTATVGAYYDIEKNQRVGITGIYRQEPYQAVQTTTVMATYTIGL